MCFLEREERNGSWSWRGFEEERKRGRGGDVGFKRRREVGFRFSIWGWYTSWVTGLPLVHICIFHNPLDGRLTLKLSKFYNDEIETIVFTRTILKPVAFFKDQNRR